MPDKPSELVQGTLDRLILKRLALEPTHGYGISVRIEQMSKGVFHLTAGSLFLAIQRLPKAEPMIGVYAASISERRFHMLLLSIFAGIATTLAGVGIYASFHIW